MAAGGRLGPVLSVLLLVACTVRAADERPLPPPPPPARPVSATIDELRTAFVEWRRNASTITYRTERQRPGLPMSPHQCLRGFVDEREDLPVALELCDPGGVVRLTTTGRERWTLDVAEGGTITRAIVDGRRGLVCVEGDLCDRRDPSRIARSFPFHELVAPVDATLVTTGLDRSGTVTIARRTLGEIVVDCFDVSSATTSVTWCFDRDGLLRSLRIRTPGRAPTIAEARRVSAAGANAFDG